MVDAIGIVGLGLMGGSLARRLHDAGCTVMAWNHTPRPYAAARNDGIICMDDLEELVLARPRLLILCNPLKAMPDVLSRIRPVIDQSATTLTDIGSVKVMVRDQVRAAGLDVCYVGAHPMAGNEHSGFESSDPRLYDGALWAVAVDGVTSYDRFLAVARCITTQIDNRVIVLDADTHDRAAAMISHTPHAIATAMINLLSQSDERNIAAALAAGSWRDMTRVSLTDPERTRAMIEEDGGNVERLLRDMATRLTTFADALHHDDDASIGEFFTQGDPFRIYAGQASEKLADTGRMRVHVRRDQGRWREQLLGGARRGEQIVRFIDDDDVEVITHAM